MPVLTRLIVDHWSAQPTRGCERPHVDAKTDCYLQKSPPASGNFTPVAGIVHRVSKVSGITLAMQKFGGRVNTTKRQSGSN